MVYAYPLMVGVIVEALDLRGALAQLRALTLGVTGAGGAVSLG